MGDDRHTGALTDETLERDLARLVAIDASPEFVARVRTAIANQEPSRSPIAALKGCATFGMRLTTRGTWRRASALRWICFAGGPVLALIIAALYVNRSAPPVMSGPPLAMHAIGGEPATLPNPGSGFERTPEARGSTSSPRARQGHVGPSAISRLARPEPVEGRARVNPAPLFDARETRALQTLIADVRDQRVDLAPLLQPREPPPMALPPVDDLIIAPIAIEPIAPQSGAQGERQ